MRSALRALCDTVETAVVIVGFLVLAVFGIAFILIIAIPVIFLTILVSPLLLAAVLIAGPRRLREAVEHSKKTEKDDAA